MEDFCGLDDLYTDEERLIAQSIRDHVAQINPDALAEAYEQARLLPNALQDMANLGLFGFTLATNMGGAGASYTAYGLMCQALEYGDSALRSAASVQNSLCIYPIEAFGSEAQQTKWLPGMCNGSVIGCFGLTEPDAGSDPSSMQTTATPYKDGWRLNGTKMWITNANLAHLAIIWAKTPEGIRGFLVEKDFEGIKVQAVKHKLSLRASDTGEIHLNNCFVPKSHLLPGTEIGLPAALKCLTKARFGIAWGAIGAAMCCYDQALQYSQSRIQFNQPIARFQLIQKSLVDMFEEIVKAQLLNFRVAQLLQAGKASFVHVSLAKKNACSAALKVAREARNILGANGISGEYPVMRHLQNLETVFTYEGTDNMHTLIVGKYLTGLDAFSH